LSVTRKAFRSRIVIARGCHIKRDLAACHTVCPWPLNPHQPISRKALSLSFSSILSRQSTLLPFFCPTKPQIYSIPPLTLQPQTVQPASQVAETLFRRAYICSVIDQVEVDDAEIRIVGRKSVSRTAGDGRGALRPECPALLVSGAPDTIRTCGLRLRRATLYPAELRVLIAYAVLTRISRMSEPQRAALASHCSTILFLPHFSHQPA
jgi:hypothetical protein